MEIKNIILLCIVWPHGTKMTEWNQLGWNAAVAFESHVATVIGQCLKLNWSETFNTFIPRDFIIILKRLMCKECESLYTV